MGFAELPVTGGDGGPVDDTVPDDASGSGALPLVWFKFEEPNGSGMYFNSGSLPVEEVGKFTQGVPGIVGRAVSLAGPTEGMTINDQPALDGFTRLTIEGWMFFDAFNTVNYSTLAKKEQAYILRTCDVASCGPQKTITLVVFDSTGTAHGCNASINPSVNTWYHVAGTYDGTVSPRILKVYFQGQELGSAAYTGGTGAAFDSVNTLTLGRADTMTEDLRGRLDEVKIWSTTRTDAEICADAGKTWTGTTCN